VASLFSKFIIFLYRNAPFVFYYRTLLNHICCANSATYGIIILLLGGFLIRTMNTIFLIPIKNPSIKDLKEQIAETKKQMEYLWESRGYTDEEVLTTSIELDRLLNLYSSIISKNKK
ncbi:MAG TPA: aspartyl-phosphate phosphatase Spo0E family protein, partial [Bacillota bacterium]|nr:aspartyl-phosphate phosphatase Spo0E family protein [Bacillota bacterium]HOL11077.1 aspartyl-phosphate phosphatase Spo0E family protein [Bacillota bacterium]